MNAQATVDKALADGTIDSDVHEAVTKAIHDDPGAFQEGMRADPNAPNFTDRLLAALAWVQANWGTIQQDFNLILAIINSLKPKA